MTTWKRGRGSVSRGQITVGDANELGRGGSVTGGGGEGGCCSIQRNTHAFQKGNGFFFCVCVFLLFFFFFACSNYVAVVVFSQLIGREPAAAMCASSFVVGAVCV